MAARPGTPIPHGVGPYHASLTSPFQSPGVPSICGETTPDTSFSPLGPGHQAVTWSSQEMAITQGVWPVAIGPDPLEVSGEKPSARIQCCPGTS